MAFQTINPSTEEIVASYTVSSHDEAVKTIESSHRAFLSWSQRPVPERAGLLRHVARILRERKNDLARLMAIEMGKPLAQGVAEAEKSAWGCEYFADHAEKFLAQEVIATDASRSFVTYEPMGVIFAVMPWNFPFWQIFRFMPALWMSGNTVILKHAPNVSGCALAIQDITRAAGLPENVLSVLFVPVETIPGVIAHPFIQGVTFTGSPRTGRVIAVEAAKHLKKCVLELGGSDPYVILEDADLESAADIAVTARLINTGQTCIAAKRFIVVESVRKPFEELVVENMKKKTYGDPLQGTWDIGPMAREDLREALHDQVDRSVRQGARLVLGGQWPGRKGWFYPPTVLTNVGKGMAAFDEETFGPVAAICSAKDEGDAIRLANDSSFGLGAAIFTRDVERGEKLASHSLQAGSCFVNALVKSDPRLPFGGIKQSGYGRELGIFGIKEFVNVKTVFIK
jgi:succinate-semialdehyde dehydrogenase/glutarate-semialdehyde dehydrogenase